MIFKTFERLANLTYPLIQWVEVFIFRLVTCSRCIFYEFVMVISSYYMCIYYKRCKRLNGKDWELNKSPTCLWMGLQLVKRLTTWVSLECKFVHSDVCFRRFEIEFWRSLLRLEGQNESSHECTLSECQCVGRINSLCSLVYIFIKKCFQLNM